MRVKKVCCSVCLEILSPYVSPFVHMIMSVTTKTALLVNLLEIQRLLLEILVNPWLVNELGIYLGEASI